MTSAAVLAGLGSFLPERRVTNEELSARLDTSDEWIRTRTGIAERRRVDPGVSTGDLAVKAGARALRSASRTADDRVDMVILATSTPDHPCPGTAPSVAARLDLGQVPAFDVAAVCSGFLYAVALAGHAIAAGGAERVLVIGADTYSTIVNPDDRDTAVIFGDGAGAVVLRRGDAAEAGAFHGFDLGSDGANHDLIQIPGGGSRQRSSSGAADPDQQYFTMQGRKVYTHAVRRMVESATRALQRGGWPIDTVDHLIGHQANLRILHMIADKMGVDRRRVITNIGQVGNTAAASIPLAMAHAASTMTAGERLLLTAFGGGLTWGSALLTWPDIVPA